MTPEDLAALKTKLLDPLWRLTSGVLYKINPATPGPPIPFIPRPEQIELFKFLMEMERLPPAQRLALLIIKSRQLGFTTAVCVYVADCLAFRSGYVAALIDKTKPDAEKKLKKVRTALEGMPVALLERLEFPTDNNSTITCRLRAAIQDTKDALNTFTAGMNARGDTFNLLHVSEWGTIQLDDPKRSEEILTGALPAAKEGIVVVETTWKGGKNGHVWDLLKPVMEKDPSTRWRMMFFPWDLDPANTQDTGTIPDTIQRYFTELEKKTGKTYTDGQKRWYASRKGEQGRFMFREYPSTLDEAFRAPIEGAIYQELVDIARTEGRIIENLPVDGAGLVHTSFDLGSPSNTVCWYWQVLPYGQGIRLIDCDVGLNLTLTERVSHMARKGYNYGFDFLPHDAATKQYNGTSFAQQWADAGRKNYRIVPRCASVWPGINLVLQMFPSFTFRLPHCEKGIEALEVVRTRPIPGGQGDELVSDWSLHPADALRMMAEATNAGLVPQSKAHSMPRNVQVLTGYEV